MQLYRDEDGTMRLVDGVDDFGAPFPLGWFAYMKTIAEICELFDCELEEAKALYERDGIRNGGV